MNVRISFDVQAETLPAGIRDAQTRLANFLGPDDNIEEWHISLSCCPEMQSQSGEALTWMVEVEAVRGSRYGKP